MNAEACIVRCLTRTRRMNVISAQAVVALVHDRLGRSKLFQHEIRVAIPLIMECASRALQANGKTINGLRQDLELLCTFPRHTCPIVTQTDYFACRGNVSVLLSILGATTASANKAATVLSDIGSLVVQGGGGTVEAYIEESPASVVPMKVYYMAHGVDAQKLEALVQPKLGPRELGRTLYGIRRLSTDVLIQDGLRACVPLEVAP